MKRFLSMVLALVLVLSMVPAMAMTVNASNTYSINGVNVSFDDFQSSPNECWVYANNIYNKIWGVQFNNSFSESSCNLRSPAVAGAVVNGRSAELQRSV